MAKYYEHRARDFPTALEVARQALARAAPAQHPAVLRRVARLERRANGRLL